MSGLRGDAAIVGAAQYRPERKYMGTRKFTLEQWADLAALALADAGLSPGEVNGLVCSNLRESDMFMPSTVAEYLGWRVNFAERVDLGGASPVGMVWRAAAAIELGICDVVVCASPGRPTPSLPSPARGAPSVPRRTSWARHRPSSTSPTATWPRTAAMP